MPVCEIFLVDSDIGASSYLHTFPVGIVTPMLHTRLHLSTTLIKRTNGHSGIFYLVCYSGILKFYQLMTLRPIKRDAVGSL
jgi:hypothetical protein